MFRIGSFCGATGDGLPVVREIVERGMIDVLTCDWRHASTELLAACVDNDIRVLIDPGESGPARCAAEIEQTVSECNVAHITGGAFDDLVPLARLADGATRVDVERRPDALHAPLSARPIAEALYEGADVVVANAVDVAAPRAIGMWHYGWTAQDLIELTGATLCGLALRGASDLRTAELFKDGRVLITKPPGVEGPIEADVVLAALLAEFTGGRHANGDVTVARDAVHISQETADRVRIEPRPGLPPLWQLPVVVCYGEREVPGLLPAHAVRQSVVG